MAPMSKASITLTPTANPAKASRIQRVSGGVAEELDTTSAKARKSRLKASNWPGTPQQAVAKKVVFKAAANPPSAAAAGEKFNCLKKTQKKQSDERKKFCVTNSPQHPTAQRVQVWRPRASIVANVIQVVPSGGKSGRESHPIGV
jgi:hypothetical protein